MEAIPRQSNVVYFQAQGERDISQMKGEFTNIKLFLAGVGLRHGTWYPRERNIEAQSSKALGRRRLLRK